MAESVLASIAGGIISKVGSLLLNEIELLWGVHEELDNLQGTVATIQSVLLHAEEQSMDNPQIKNWLAMLTEAMYDAEDLLDEFSTEVLHQQVMGGPKFAKKVRLFFSSSNRSDFGIKMGHEVKALRQRLDKIASDKRFHLEERSNMARSFGAKVRDPTHSSPPQVVIGREHDKEAISELLFSSEYDENVSIVAIVGLGGLGKTTVAQMVFNDDRIKNHFELKMWVCVSDDFNVRSLVKKVLESVTGETPNIAEMEPLKNLLHEKINGRKYLLVLDDVWNVDVNKWSDFKDLLVGGARGSKIVITNRVRKVAEMSRPIYIHELRGLSENEAWSLFKKLAFKQGQALNPSQKAMGKEIVAKCCGVPLAIKTIGGMLYFKDLESEWVLFKDKELSKIDVYQNDIVPILKLSYNHLPSHCKQCFAYCSLYPKDFRIPVEELIQLWKAQGYCKSADVNECLQDVGFGCFMELLQLSFFQDVEKDKFGNIEYCRMHDLMHELAISAGGGKFSASHSGKTSITDKTQHVSFRVDEDSFSPDFSSLLKAKKIRTVLPLAESEYVHIKRKEVDTLFCNLRCLRVLNLSHLQIGTLPSSIYKLKHLRYLDLSKNYRIKKLPDSIANLQNLGVLKLSSCTRLMQLPDSITKLVNLTDLDDSYCHGLTHMPRGIGKLTRLEQLSKFVIAKDNFVSRFIKHSGGLDELHALNNLRGELEIKNLKYMRNVTSEIEIKAADLCSKQHLQKLKLDWSRSRNGSENDVANDDMGLEALRPHQNLKDLSVVDYRGVRPPSWLLSITNLVSLCFENCKSIQWLPPFHRLPYLKKLKVWDLTDLERLDVENGESSSFFPSLTYLCFYNCPNLKGFVIVNSKEQLPCFPLLSKLEIDECPNLACLPLFPELEQLTLGEHGLKSLMKVLKTGTTSASQSTSSPFSSLSRLQHLEISLDEEESLEDELLQYLPSLRHLELRFFEYESLCSDDADNGMQWQRLKALRSIEFICMRNLVSLPKGLQYVTTLQRLLIRNCVSLSCIPEWMGCLTALQQLDIAGSPLLSERCNNNTAEDWPKISHIPNIYVDTIPIQRNGCYLL